MKPPAVREPSQDGYELPRHLTPMPDESLPGLVQRNAALYGFQNPMRLFHRLRPPNVDLSRFCAEDPDGAMGRATCTLLGLEPAVHRRMSLWSGTGKVTSILGVPVWTDLAHPSGRSVCTECLRASDHHRAAWLVGVLPACPVHGAWLRNRCPDCGRLLEWRGHGVYRCGYRSCRSDLRQAPVERLAPDIVQGIRAFVDILSGDVAPPMGMPPGEAIRVALVLGQFWFGFEKAKRTSSFVLRQRDRLPEIMAAGWRALDDWPDGFGRLLDHVAARAPSRARKAGLGKAFGVLSKHVYEWSRTPWGMPIGQAFAQHAASRPEIATSSRTLTLYSGGVAVRQTNIPAAQAASMLGISGVGLMRTVERRKLCVLPSRKAGQMVMIAAADVQRLRDELDGHLLPEQARTILGVGTKVMAQLEDACLFRRLSLEERVMEFKPFVRTEMEALVSACRGDAATVTADEARAMGLTDIGRLVAPGRGHPDVCRALLDGRLRARAVVAGRPGIGGIRLGFKEVAVVLPAKPSTLTAKDIVGLSGMRRMVVKGWIRRGLLPTTVSNIRAELGERFTMDAWEMFAKEYVGGEELSRLFGMTRNYGLSRQLGFLGVRPVSGPDVDGIPMVLFRRSDITPEVTEAVRRLRAGRPGDAQDRLRASFGRNHRAAQAVADLWGADFRRVNNRYTDLGSGRVLQMIAGRRPSMNGVFRFWLKAPSMKRMRETPGATVALVAVDAGSFLLVPFDRVGWRKGDRDGGCCVTVSFDIHGEPTTMKEYAVAMPPP